jgi:hypothetical protein
MYWTEWTATITVKIDGKQVDKYTSRVKTDTAEQARAAFRRGAMNEWGEVPEAKITVGGLKQLIWDNAR